MKREFQFVPYGKQFCPPSAAEETDSEGSRQRPTVSCDGRIPGGVTLELSHWTGNETPDDLYADTSTEMALSFDRRCRQDPCAYQHLSDAYILNNHYDTDGVLSVFACLNPEIALSYADLLVQGAEAGDFGEWSSDEGVKLDCTLEAICEQLADEEQAYHVALKDLPNILHDLNTNSGKSYQYLWKSKWDEVISGWSSLKTGQGAILCGPHYEMAIIMEPSIVLPLSPYALDRGLKDFGLWSSKTLPTRILRVSTKETKSSTLYRYQYEKIGHGWVQKLVKRAAVPSVGAEKLVEQLNTDGRQWSCGGSSGLVSICCTHDFIATTPEEVSQRLLQHDAAFR